MAKAKLGLVLALTVLATAITQRVLMTPQPTPSAPREMPPPEKAPSNQPLPEIPDELNSSAADRFVRKATADELRDVDARLVALESLVCKLKQNLRALEAQHVKQSGGKRGVEARDEFLAASAAWEECPAVKAGDKPQQLPSLREKADSALRR